MFTLKSFLRPRDLLRLTLYQSLADRLSSPSSQWFISALFTQLFFRPRDKSESQATVICDITSVLCDVDWPTISTQTPTSSQKCEERPRLCAPAQTVHYENRVRQKSTLFPGYRKRTALRGRVAALIKRDVLTVAHFWGQKIPKKYI